MPKGVPNKRYTAEFKKLVIETMQEEKLSYSETCRRFDVNSRDQIKSWERIYLEEGPEGFGVQTCALPIWKALPLNGAAAAVRVVRQSSCRSR